MVLSLKLLQRLGAAIVLIGVTFLVYWPAQRNGFVWDDTALVARDPLIRSWRLIPEAFNHFLFLDATASNFYRPLQRLTFLADYAFWDMNARGFHLTSIYAHLAAAIALFFLVEKLLPPPRQRLYALWIAGIWAIHPLHTEAVTYIAGRADSLAAFFGFTALALGLRTLDPDGDRRGKILATAGAALCFMAALLSKESGVFAIVIWLLILWLRKEPRRQLTRWALIAAAVLLSYAGLRVTAEKTEPPKPKISAYAPARAVLIARAWADYVVLWVAPHNLHMERDVAPPPRNGAPPVRPQHGLENPGVKTALGAVLWAGLLCWALWARRQRPLAVLGLLGFFAAYLPISNVYALNATSAEHWLYVPSAFLLIAIAASVQPSLECAGRRWLRPGLGLALGAWSLWLGICTRDQQSYWFDQRSFVTRTIAAGGDSARMHVNLGNIEAASFHTELARAEYQSALQRAPKLPFALLGLAALDIQSANYDSARALLNQAAEEPLLAPQCLQMRASLEYRESKRDVLPLLSEAVALAPTQWPIRRRYILALEQTGHRDQAIRELRLLLEREPFRADSWKLLAELLANSQQPERAIAAFERAVQLDVHDLESQARIDIIRRTLAQKPGQ